MIRWLRVVWPPWWALVLALMVFVIPQSALLFEEWKARIPLFSARGNPEQANILIGVMGIAIFYAVYRVWHFHPALRPAYYRWLCSTPWTSAKALPLGPIHLVGQDALLLAIAIGLNWPRLGIESLYVGLIFLSSYLLSLGAVHFLVGERLWAYAVFWGLGGVVFFLKEPALLTAVVAVSYGFAWLGLRQSLARFPWDDFGASEKWLEMLGQRPLGWPFDRMGPKFLDLFRFEWQDKLLTAVLTGWWFFVVGSLIRQSSPSTFAETIAATAATLFVGFSAAIRVASYCDRYRPPITLFGRLLTGRWIIPGFDKVLLAPASAIAVGAAAVQLPDWIGLDGIVATALEMTLSTWILLAMGPSLQNWRLTGNHRIVPGWFSSAFYTR